MKNDKTPMTFSITESGIELLAGTALLLFSLLLIFVLIPTQVKYGGSKTINPQTVPYMWSGLILILSIASLVNGVRKRKQSDQEVVTVTSTELKLILFSILCIALCAFAMKYLPYLAVTIPILAVMMLVFGQRSKWKIALVSICVPMFIYVLFTVGLHFRLP